MEGVLATAFLSLSICRALGEAVMPSAPVAWYPTEATVVEGVLATVFLLSSICRTFGEAVIPSSPVGRYCALAVKVKTPAAATASSRVFFIVLSFFVVAACCRCSFTSFNTPHLGNPLSFFSDARHYPCNMAGSPVTAQKVGRIMRGFESAAA